MSRLRRLHRPDALSPMDPATPAYRALVAVAVPVMTALTRLRFSGGHRVPAQGGLIVVANHTSNLDTFPLGVFMVSQRRAPRWLAKESLFRGPFGVVIRQFGHIPVHRNTTAAGDALRAAEQVLREGRSLVVLPEGTFTADPDLWPMRGKTGAARLALATRCPVLPVAQWGIEQVWHPRAGIRLRWRPKLAVRAGAPVDLSDLYGQPLTRQVLDLATDRIMDAITHELEVLRGEKAPLRRHDPGSHRGPGGARLGSQ